MILILKALPSGVIEVFTAVHMFYKSAAGEHLLSLPFFLIRLGSMIEHIVIDQYSTSHTNHSNVDTTPAHSYTLKEMHVNIHKQARLNTFA